MLFALCGPDGGFIILALLMLLVLGGACLAAAIFVTVALAKWAAARHNRLAANEG
jgi:hypothetical protein